MNILYKCYEDDQQAFCNGCGELLGKTYEELFDDGVDINNEIYCGKCEFSDGEWNIV